MQGLIVEIAPIGGNVTGYFRAAKGAITYDKVTVDPSFLHRPPDAEGPDAGNPVDEDTLTHELIHFLRLRDPDRRGSLDREWIRVDDEEHMKADVDREEAMTEAETLARMGQSPTNWRGGYHEFIQPAGREKGGFLQGEPAKMLVLRDKQVLAGLRNKDGRAKYEPRQLAREIDIDRGAIDGEPSSRQFRGSVQRRNQIVGRMFRGKPGRPGRAAVRDRFPDLAIAYVQIKGESEAIDSYFEYKGEIENVGEVMAHTHVHSPTGNPDPQVLNRIVTGGPTCTELRTFRLAVAL